MPDTNSAAAAVPTDGLPVRTPKKAAIAAWIGSALEYYDFVIYGTAAALVFPKIFFPDGNAAAATVASLATFGVGYVARPIGSFLMGHLGDRLGPQAGADRHAAAHGPLDVPRRLPADLRPDRHPRADPPRRAAPPPGPLGVGRAGRCQLDVLRARARQPARLLHQLDAQRDPGRPGAGPAVFLPLAAVLSEDQLLTWGWRIPFLLSASSSLVGYIIRRRLDETPAFSEEVAHGEVPRTPLAVLFKYHWRGVLRVFFAAFIAMVNTMLHGLRADLRDLGDLRQRVQPRPSCCGSPSWPTSSRSPSSRSGPRLSDRVGRKPIFVTGAIGSAVLVMAFLGGDRRRATASWS